jgi:hypothetical protein
MVPAATFQDLPPHQLPNPQPFADSVMLGAATLDWGLNVLDDIGVVEPCGCLYGIPPWW